MNGLDRFFHQGEQVWFHDGEWIYPGVVLNTPSIPGDGYLDILPNMTLRDPPEMQIPVHHVFETKEEAARGLLRFISVDFKRARFNMEKAREVYKEKRQKLEEFLNG